MIIILLILSMQHFVSTDLCLQSKGWTIFGENQIKVFGPMTQVNAVRECKKHCGELMRPILSNYLTLQELMSQTGITSIWIDAKWKKGFHYRYSDGTPVKNVNAIPVKKGSRKRRCLAYDILQSQFVRKQCRNRIKAFCSKDASTIEPTTTITITSSSSSTTTMLTSGTSLTTTSTTTSSTTSTSTSTPSTTTTTMVTSTATTTLITGTTTGTSSTITTTTTTTTTITTTTITTSTTTTTPNPCNCGICSANPQSRIVGGATATEDHICWQVVILPSYEFANGTVAETLICGGVIIDTRYILTAAHCMNPREHPSGLPIYLMGLPVYAGIHSVTSWLQAAEGAYSTHYANFKVNHPNYDIGTSKYDLALVQVDTPFDINAVPIRPICLPEQGFMHEAGTIIQVSGFGRLTGDGYVTTTMQSVNLTIKEPTECNPEILSTLDESIQVCSNTEGMTTCNGDSGGPATTVNPSTGRMELVGLVSFGDANCDRVAVFTRVSQFIDWIKDTVSDATCF